MDTTPFIKSQKLNEAICKAIDERLAEIEKELEAI